MEHWDPNDANTKQQLDSIEHGKIAKDIDLGNKYIVKDSKTRARSELNSAKQSLINFEQGRENFVAWSPGIISKDNSFGHRKSIYLQC